MEERQQGREQCFTAIHATLSPTEERFERYRRTVGLFLGPVVAVLLFLLPLPGLTPKAHTLAAIIGWIVVWWVTEPIPIPVSALFGAVLCVLCGVASAAKALGAFAEPPIFLFLGSFILAKAMTVHGLDKRFAYRILSIPWVGNSSARILLVYGAVGACTSMWISNTATTAMLLPIGLGIISTMADIMAARTGKAVAPTRLRFGTGMMLMAAYAASVGGIGTPVGTPPNLIGMAMIDTLVGVKISFIQWMVVPVMISLANAAEINPIPPALGATLGASWGFMLPVSTPPNAIVYGSGMIPITRMIRAGILFDIAGALLLWLGLRLVLPLVGLA